MRIFKLLKLSFLLKILIQAIYKLPLFFFLELSCKGFFFLFLLLRRCRRRQRIAKNQFKCYTLQQPFLVQFYLQGFFFFFIFAFNTVKLNPTSFFKQRIICFYDNPEKYLPYVFICE